MSDAGVDAAGDAPEDALDSGALDAASDSRPGQDGVTVAIASGSIRGVLAGSTRRFLGIPYAAPPIGERRFLAPAPVARWQGTRDATTFGPSCLNAGNATSPASEDCLSLNVFAPAATPAKPLPVMAFIHGGAFIAGGSATYEAQRLRETGNVVVVTLNYRLAAFGFLEHPALAALGKPYSNQGLRDQQLALRWVRDNIHVFGGDPHNVTLFGESAGSVSVCSHLFAKGSDGLGRRFVLQSGACAYGGLAVQPKEYAAASGRTIVDALCPGASDVLACLRGRSAADVANVTVPSTDPVVVGAWPWVDGDLFAGAPEALLASGSFARGSVLAGSNHVEWLLWQVLGGTPVVLGRAQLATQIARYFGAARAPAITAHYTAATDLQAGDVFLRLMSDAYFRCPTRALVRGAVAQGREAYLYDFDVTPAAHALDVDYVFDQAAVSTLFPFQAPNPLVSSVVRAMQGYWTSFATSGTPAGAGLLAWPAYTKGADPHLVIREPLEVSRGLSAADCDFWDGVWGVPH